MAGILVYKSDFLSGKLRRSWMNIGGFSCFCELCIIHQYYGSYYGNKPLSFAVVVFLLSSYGRNFLTQALYEVNYQQGKLDYGLVHGDVFLNLTQTPRYECFYRCSTDCRCLAFQMFEDTDCELLSSSRFEIALQRMPGYTYYDIKHWQVPGDCPDTGPIYCCKQKPCLNGATCQHPTEAEQRRLIRFRCVCRRGYGGRLCQHRIGCSGYLDILTSPANGLYTIVNPKTGEQYKTYCKFEYARRNPDVLFAWTVIQSYEMQKVNQIKPFITDAPINEMNFNWQAWRLSKANMNELMKIESNKWIMTCDYEKHGLKKEEDFLSVKIVLFNILEEDNAVGKCTKAVQFRVRNEGCNNCEIAITQTGLYPLHVNTDLTSRDACGGSIPSISAGCHEDSFGWYQCVNTTHRCAASPQSTTQTWVEF